MSCNSPNFLSYVITSTYLAYIQVTALSMNQHIPYLFKTLKSSSTSSENLRLLSTHP
ncbi:hypothetical protein BDV34DRAFT_189404 [Aspergillus parasiticus]|uniref:Uncharacterized protein n=1 Tax=Aspergillus parasiticus TaxID=5067 RepID=A0A5N6DW99_ASPPA|nr:hypothetical protein BDV34DRAFT_189404 [Aspergillus parasiticus]